MNMSKVLGKRFPADPAVAVRAFAADAKILFAVAYAASIALCGSWQAIVALAVVLAAVAAAAGVSVRRAMRGLRPIACIVGFALVVSALAGDVEGLREGAFYSVKLVLLFAATALLVDVTPLPDFAGAFRRMLKPLGRFGLNVDDAAVTVSLAFRFLSVFADEARRITLAQRARGLDPETKGPIGRVKTFGPIVIPLIVSLFRHAERVAVALEARCFAAGKRTSLSDQRPRALDLALGIAAGACLVALSLAL